MNNPEPTARKLHPLIATAAVAVIVASVLAAIVLITDQVAAHRGQDSAALAANDTGTGAPPAPLTPPPKASSPAARAGSAPLPAPPVARAAPPAPPVCNSCGTVAAVRPVKTQGEGSGVGAVAGGAVGGLVGNQFGSGKGKTAMTVLGVVGGALGGNEVEKEVKATTRWYVDVRMDNGQLRTVPVPGDPGSIVGARVRIQNGQLVREATPQS